jgi:hypothetical protein
MAVCKKCGGSAFTENYHDDCEFNKNDDDYEIYGTPGYPFPADPRTEEQKLKLKKAIEYLKKEK